MLAEYIEKEDWDKEKVLEQIELEMRKILVSVERLYNNLSETECLHPIEKSFVTNTSYSTNILTREINVDVEDGSINALDKLKNSLQNELDCLESDIDQLIKFKRDKVEMCSSIQNNLQNLEAMKVGSKDRPQSTPEVILKNLKTRFKKEKSDLKSIITTLFADNPGIQDLIARIIEYHFDEGPDKYLQLEDDDDVIKNLELLRQTNLFEVHPSDILQIKLADLVE